MDENAPATEPRPEGQDADAAPAQDANAPKRTAAEHAETFNKAVDAAEQVLRFAPLPAGAKRVATRAMPTVKKVAKVAPMVAPAAEPYVRKAAAKAKEVAPEVAQAAKTGAKTVAAGAQTGARAAASGAKTVAGHVRETAPKLGHAVSDGAKAAATRVHDDAPNSAAPPPTRRRAWPASSSARTRRAKAVEGSGDNAQIEPLTKRLQGRDNADAYAALKELLALSEATDAVSAHFDTFARLLHAKSAFARTRGFLLIVANARWDAEERTAGIFDDLARLFNDPKPTTARQCVQAAPALAQAQPTLVPRIAEALEGVDPGRYPDSTAPLVAADVAAALEAVRALGSTAT